MWTKIKWEQKFFHVKIVNKQFERSESSFNLSFAFVLLKFTSEPLVTKLLNSDPIKPHLWNEERKCKRRFQT